MRDQGVVGAGEEVDLDDIRDARPQRIAFEIAKTLVRTREVFRRVTAALDKPWLFPRLVEICEGVACGLRNDRAWRDAGALAPHAG